MKQCQEFSFSLPSAIRVGKKSGQPVAASDVRAASRCEVEPRLNLPRPLTGFQVKTQDMQRGAILQAVAGSAIAKTVYCTARRLGGSRMPSRSIGSEYAIFRLARSCRTTCGGHQFVSRCSRTISGVTAKAITGIVVISNRGFNRFFPSHLYGSANAA